MLYQRKSFSVSSSANKSAMCAEKGHSGADSRGNCYCCGEKIVTPGFRETYGAMVKAQLEPMNDEQAAEQLSRSPFAVLAINEASGSHTAEEQKALRQADPDWVECIGGPFDGALFQKEFLEYMPGIRVYSLEYGEQRVFYRARRELFDGAAQIVFDGFDR